MEKRNCVAFAYFADGKFIGWYADSFGSIRNCPKIYDNTDRQKGIITSNFTAKVRKAKGLQEDDFLSNAAKTIGKYNAVGAALMTETKSELSGYTDIELRIVECPIYDGPNPDFDKEANMKAYEAHLALFNASGIPEKYPTPGIDRYKAVQEFNKEHPYPKSNNWIYADYEEVKKWAANEPTEFIGTIKSE